LVEALREPLQASIVVQVDSHSQAPIVMTLMEPLPQTKHTLLILMAMDLASPAAQQPHAHPQHPQDLLLRMMIVMIPMSIDTPMLQRHVMMA